MPSPVQLLKFRTRAWLIRLGIWHKIEHWRLARRYKRRLIHESDFAFFEHLAGSTGLFVDIGANVGQSALSFAAVQPTCPILSFEPNYLMESSLQAVAKLLGTRFAYRMHGLGATNEEKILHVPTVKGIAFLQYGTFSRERLTNNPDLPRSMQELTGSAQFDILEQTIKIHRFDDLNLAPEVVKMDVEGAELEVLIGMEQTLANHRPLLLTEGDSVRPWLRQRGYQAFCHDPGTNSLRRLVGSPLNVFFLPEEKVEYYTQMTARRVA